MRPMRTFMTHTFFIIAIPLGAGLIGEQPSVWSA